MHYPLTAAKWHTEINENLKKARDGSSFSEGIHRHNHPVGSLDYVHASIKYASKKKHPFTSCSAENYPKLSKMNVSNIREKPGTFGHHYAGFHARLPQQLCGFNFLSKIFCSCINYNSLFD